MKLHDLLLTAHVSKTERADLKQQALREAAEKFSMHPSTASLTWANARYRRLVNENSYEDDYEESHLANGDYVRDSQGDSEVFKLVGNPQERRVQIHDKHGRGWNIMPSRLVKVTDPAAIARWFPEQDNEDKF